MVKLGGEMRDMTILVTDLRGFTVATEGMEASRIVKIINRYLDKMVPIVMRHESTIDEFTGDGILVFFGLFWISFCAIFLSARSYTLYMPVYVVSNYS
jgi:class 3 adenylate cyclase